MSSQTIQLLEQALIQANEEQNQEDIEVFTKALLDQIQQQQPSDTSIIIRLCRASVVPLIHLQTCAIHVLSRE